MTHTPGPWAIEGKFVKEEATRYQDFICKEPEGFYQNDDKWKANARLIAAAPDLLAALEEAIELFDQDDNDLTLAGKRIVSRWRATVEKATGE